MKNITLDLIKQWLKSNFKDYKEIYSTRQISLACKTILATV